MFIPYLLDQSKLTQPAQGWMVRGETSTYFDGSKSMRIIPKIKTLLVPNMRNTVLWLLPWTSAISKLHMGLVKMFEIMDIRHGEKSPKS